MDRIEYKTKMDEIANLVKQGNVQEAIDELDSINWRKVRNVNALMETAEVYESLGKLEQAKELLLYAHDRSPIGRMIIYRLALICIKLNEFEEAKDYYDEFVEIAPRDSLKYLIKYQICKAQGVDDAILIKILEELKENDFLEEWSFELACLYHKTAQIDKCIDLCDEIILWFGDGIYVEKALELKMLYQPLDKQQEDKYRQFQLRKDGLTEIHPEDPDGSGEILHNSITIPQVELKPERFNTVNLQAEIKKNIEEIMRATEAGEVSENMDNIKMLVEEIPYLQVQEEVSPQEQIQKDQTIDQNLKDSFQEYLAEEYDGQMSLNLPEEKQTESQVKGQMTIEEIMGDWEKTKRAAEAALQEAQQQKLEIARQQALKEANNIMDRLEGVIPKLDAGVAPAELLKEEYLQEQEHFDIPKIPQGVGLEIPVVHIDPAMKAHTELEMPTVTKGEEGKDTKDWEPPVLGDESESNVEAEKVDVKEASKIVADVNEMLQNEIDRLTQEISQESGLNDAETEMVENISELSLDVNCEELVEEPTEEVELDVEPVEDVEEASDGEPEETAEIEIEEPIDDIEEKSIDEELPEIEEIILDPEEVAELVDEQVLEKAIVQELPAMKLTEEEKQIFSYFMPISGMESSICQVLTGARDYLMQNGASCKGNIVIQGNAGSGKTMMATNLIKVLQMETDKLTGPVGRIDGDKLNDKDIQQLFGKIKGGCLIIEKAGEVNRETAVTLSLLMENDSTGTLLIMEDSRVGIERVMGLNVEFSKKFTEKITIPVFTIDELVNFGKAYAKDEGYALDDVGILALYNRINLIQRLDHPTSLVEVKEIMDEAMERADRGKGLFGKFGSKKCDEDGNIILKEKDFEE